MHICVGSRFCAIAARCWNPNRNCHATNAQILARMITSFTVSHLTQVDESRPRQTKLEDFPLWSNGLAPIDDIHEHLSGNWSVTPARGKRRLGLPFSATTWYLIFLNCLYTKPGLPNKREHTWREWQTYQPWHQQSFHPHQPPTFSSFLIPPPGSY